MTDVFISYAREDRARVRPLADALSARGLVVWWDPELRAGRDFRTEIVEALSTTRAMIVAWSRYSTASRFVRDEADEGAAREILFPVLLDLVDVPLGFRQTHTLDLTGWRGEANYPPCEALIQTIASFVASSSPSPHPAPPASDHSKQSGMLPFSITGVLARSRLQIRATVFSAIVAALAFALWTLVALISENVADDCSAKHVPPLIGELLACGFFWSRALAVIVIAFILTLLARGLTFYADSIFGRTSLNLFSRSFAVTVLAAVLLAAPIELDLQFSSFAFVRPFRDAVMSENSTRIYASSFGKPAAMDASNGRRLSTIEVPALPAPKSTLSDGRTVSKDSDNRAAINESNGSRVILSSADCTEKTSGLCDVNFVSVSPDGARILTASNDGIARIWDGTGAEITALKGHRDKIYSARYSPDGKFIITTSADRTIAIWRAGKGKLIHQFVAATPLIGSHPAKPIPFLQPAGAIGVPKYDFSSLGISALIVRGLGILALAVALTTVLGKAVRHDLQPYLGPAVMIAVAAAIAFVYAINLPAEGLLFWLLYAAVLTPFAALGRLALALLMRPAFASQA